MTFHESYGQVRKDTLRLIRKYNVSPADYDTLLAACGWDWTKYEVIDFDVVNDMIVSASRDGYYRPSRYM